MKEADQGIANPLHAEPYTRLVGQSIQWWKSINLTASVAPEKLLPYIPERFTLVDARILIVISEHHQTGTGHTFGAMLYANAAFEGTTGLYPLIGFSSSDGYVCASREQLGAPMLLCDETSLVFQGNTVSGEVTRHGQPILSGQVFPLVDDKAPVPLWGEGQRLLHYKKIPNGDPNSIHWREVLSIETSVSPAGVVQVNPGRGSLLLKPTIWEFHQLDPAVTGASFCHLEGPKLESVRVLWAR